MQLEFNDDCLSCEDFGLLDCSEYIINENYYNNTQKMEQYICTKCNKYYFLSSDNNCGKCIVTNAVSNNECISCENEVTNCLYCESNEDGIGVQFKECKAGYILNSDENICLKREENKDLNELNKCLVFKK